MFKRRVIWIFSILAIIYLLESLLIPPDQSSLKRYELLDAEARALKLTITLPLIVIWSLGFYAYSKFDSYAELVKKSPEGKALKKISYGLLAMALWLPLSSIISSIITYAYGLQPNLTAPMTILNNYVNLALVFTAVYILFRGTHMLRALAKKPGHWRWATLSSIFVSTISIFYVYVAMTNPVRQRPSGDSLAAFYMPDWLSLITLILPYVIVFILGFKAVEYIHTYKQQAQGIIYRQALKNIANGLAIVVISLIAVRYLASLNTFVASADLKLVLQVIYGFVLLIAIGFIVLASGTKRLKRIEEI